MRRAALVGLVVSLGCSASEGEPPLETVQGHVAAAVAAAGTDHIRLVDRICTQATGEAPRPGGAEPTVPLAFASIPGREDWYAEPKRVFDNLIWVGQTQYTAWAVTTPEGIIVIDALFDYSVEAEVVEGLRAMGLDPETIRYVIVSHGHRDHAGGARYLQEHFGARVIMHPADWDLLDRTGGDWPKPERDIGAQDGFELTLGGTKVTLYHTPGHTPGTLSTVIPVSDGGEPHTALLVGGTAFNFIGGGDEEHWYREYASSAQRLASVAKAVGADVLLSNHPQYDGATAKIPALAERGPRDPHPFVIGNDAVLRYLTVATECARAGLLALE